MYKLKKVGFPLLWVLPGVTGIFLLVASIWRPFDWASPMGIFAGITGIAFAVYFFFENRKENRELPERQKEFDDLRKSLWEPKK